MTKEEFFEDYESLDKESQRILLGAWGNTIPLGDTAAMQQKGYYNRQEYNNAKNKNFFLGETIRGMNNVSPLVAYKFFNQNSNDILNKYFIDAPPHTEGTFTYCSDVRSDLKKYIKHVQNFEYDRAKTKEFAFRVILFSSTEATKLKECFDVCIAKDREILIFIEDNYGDDTSATYGAIRISDEIKPFLNEHNGLAYDFQNNQNIYAYLEEQGITITKEEMQQLFHKGYLEDTRMGFVKNLFEFASILSYSMNLINPSMAIFTNDLARKGTSKILEEIIKKIEEYRLAENVWQPKPPKKEDGTIDNTYQYQPLIATSKNQQANINLSEIVKYLREKLEKQHNEVRTLLKIDKDFRKNHEPKSLLQFLYNKYVVAYDVAFDIINEIKDLTELEILKYGVKCYNALICGVWNGLVDAVSGLFAMVKMIFDGISLGADFAQNVDKYLPMMLEQFDETIQAISKISFTNAAKYVYSKLKEINLTFDPVACAYFLGYVYGFIISLVIEIVLTGGSLTIPVIVEKVEEALFGIFRLAWSGVKSVAKTVRTFVKFVVKSIEDLIKSFQELLNSLKKGWEEFKKIIDELFARLKNIKNERRVKPRSNYFNSIADPVADILGAAIKSHPERLKNIMLDLKNKGVEIVFRSDEALGYSPGLSKGQPGQIIIHENASISAWEHEYIHFLNDQEKGFLGMSSLFDSNYRVYTELNAYTKEIEFVKSLSGNNQNIIKQLKLNFDDEFNYIINNFGKVQDKNLLSKIEIFKNL